MFEYTRIWFDNLLGNDWVHLGYHDGAGSVSMPDPSIPVPKPIHPIFKWSHRDKKNLIEITNRDKGLRNRHSGASKPDNQGPSGVRGLADVANERYGVKWRNGKDYMSNSEYKLMFADMEHVFALASAMLDTPASLEFLYNVIFCNRTMVEPRKPEDEAFLALDIDPYSATAAIDRHEQARQALNRLAESLTWQFDNSIQPDEHAVTTPYLDEYPDGVGIRDNAGSHKGLASSIKLGQSSLDDLRRLSNENVDVRKLLTLRFKVALTMCHEVAHAAEFAVGTNRLTYLTEWQAAGRPEISQAEKDQKRKEFVEPCYGGEVVAELGYSWEQQVFGGTVVLDNEIDYCMSFSKWPNHIARKKEHPCHGLINYHCTKWMVPLRYIANVNDREFWAQATHQDTTVLLMQKTRGTELSGNKLTMSRLNLSGREDDPADRPRNRRQSSRVAKQSPDPSSSGANSYQAPRHGNVSGAGGGDNDDDDNGGDGGDKHQNSR